MNNGEQKLSPKHTSMYSAVLTMAVDGGANNRFLFTRRSTIINLFLSKGILDSGPAWSRRKHLAAVATDDYQILSRDVSGHVPSSKTGQFVEFRSWTGTKISRVGTSTCESSRYIAQHVKSKTR
ncbi:hypothetical protein PsorP6_002279 [Peronosclerospora sorghi]|uniref:Uncharacterized protein n=1 Tax=Peronosclerospora sorghi TaxID=230839 RepID=A0ACC0WZ04_9STRA|nr:hypothetical protein PsorP6_002279 [Peronosclerospora sorghi]